MKKQLKSLGQKAIRYFLEDGSEAQSLFDLRGLTSWRRIVGSDAPPPYRHESLLDGYGKNPWFFIVIDKIASMAASMPRRLVFEGERTSVPRRPGFEGVMQSPNDFESDWMFRYRMAATLLAAGEVFVYWGGTPGMLAKGQTQLICPIPTDVTANYSRDSPRPENYTFSFRGLRRGYVPPEFMLHIARPNILNDDLHGSAEGLRMLFLLDNEIWGSGYALHKRKGVNGLVSGKGDSMMLEHEREQLQNQFDAMAAGRENFGKIATVSTAIQYTQMGINPKDLQSVEMNLGNMRAACAAFGLPSQLLNDPSASTYNNMKEARKDYLTQTVLPLCDRIDESLTRFLLPDDRVRWEVDRESIAELNEVDEVSAKVIREDFSSGLISRSEARAIRYPELPPDAPDGREENNEGENDVNEETEDNEEPGKPE